MGIFINNKRTAITLSDKTLIILNSIINIHFIFTAPGFLASSWKSSISRVFCFKRHQKERIHWTLGEKVWKAWSWRIDSSRNWTIIEQNVFCFFYGRMGIGKLKDNMKVMNLCGFIIVIFVIWKLLLIKTMKDLTG